MVAAEKVHLTGKPVPLLVDLLQVTPEGGTILDPFMQLTIFPLNKGEGSLAPYVARALRVIRESGLPYVLGPMYQVKGTGKNNVVRYRR